MGKWPENGTYEDLLKDPQWQAKRKVILDRDQWKCQKCRNRSYVQPGLFGIPLDPNRNSYSQIVNLDGDVLEEIKIGEGGYAVLPHRAMVYFSKDESGKIDVAAARKLTKKETETASWNTVPEMKAHQSIDSFCKELMENFKRFQTQRNQMLASLQPKTDAEYSALKWLFVRGIHVHHTFYRLGRDPWDYPNESLQTLCRKCHHELHQTTSVPVLDTEENVIGDFKPCTTCDGTGYRAQFHYHMGGVCFTCMGKKYLDDSYIRKR